MRHLLLRLVSERFSWTKKSGSNFIEYPTGAPTIGGAKYDLRKAKFRVLLAPLSLRSKYIDVDVDARTQRRDL